MIAPPCSEWYNSLHVNTWDCSNKGVTYLMKAEIHPKYYQSKVRCNCGNEFITGSTKEEIRVEVCSKCHPFYTGSQKMLIEAGGRVERFKKKYNM